MQLFSNCTYSLEHAPHPLRGQGCGPDIQDCEHPASPIASRIPAMESAAWTQVAAGVFLFNL